MRISIFFILLFFNSSFLFSQINNRNIISVSTGDFKNFNFKNSKYPTLNNFSNPTNLCGFSLEKRICRDNSIGLSFQSWNKQCLVGRENIVMLGERYVFDTVFPQLDYRYKYKMIDLFFNHYFDFDSKHNQFIIAAGPSLTWGINNIITSAINVGYPYNEWYIENAIEKRSYYGFVLSTGYNYFFYKQHFLVGLKLNDRIYKTFHYQILDYHIRLGVNF